MAKFGGWYLKIFFKTYCKYGGFESHFLKAVKSVPCRQLNVLWVMVCTQIEHGVDELNSLHFQDLQVCREKEKKNDLIVPPSQVLHAIRAPLWPPHHQTELQRPS